MAKISVVVPVYNVEDYLDWCLESLQSQTLEDIEIVCVNDGSTDSSAQKLTEWAKKDHRIVTVSKENGGLSSARNEGVRKATAPIVCFLDSDDRFTANACETIVAAFERTDAEVVTFGANCYPTSAAYPWLEQHLSPREVTYSPFHKDLLFKEMSRPFAWRTACKREFLLANDLLFDEGLKFGEDQVFHFAVYPRSECTALIPDKLYDYRVSREGSLMHSVVHDLYAKCSEHVNIVSHILENWEQDGFLNSYSGEMAEWIVEFLLYETICLPEDQANEILRKAGKALAPYWNSNDIDGLLMRASSKAILQLCYAGKTSSRNTLRRRRLAYRAQRDGVLNVARSFFTHQ